MEIVPWLALAVSLFTITAAVIDRIVNRGKELQRLATLELLVGTQSAQQKLTESLLVEFKIEVAKTYVANHELADAMHELTKRLDRIDDRLDKFLGLPARNPTI
jgi:hypothetical protein